MSLNLRHHYSILIVLVGLVAILTLAIGDMQVIAYTTQTESISTEEAMFDYTNETALFDDSVVHSIQSICRKMIMTR